MKEKKYMNTNSGNIFTLEELKAEFTEWKRKGVVDYDCFTEWLQNGIESRFFKEINL